MSAGLNGINTVNRMGLLKGQLLIGGYTVSSLPVGLDHQRALLGIELLKKFRVQINTGSKLVRFWNGNSSSGMMWVKMPFGIGVTRTLPAGDALVIISVGDQSPAMLAGLHPGDRVLEIDGDPATEPDVSGHLGWIFPEPRTLTLLIEREGERITLETGMERLFPGDEIPRGPDLELPSIDIRHAPGAGWELVE